MANDLIWSAVSLAARVTVVTMLIYWLFFFVPRR